jgi:hypothetical protein
MRYIVLRCKKFKVTDVVTALKILEVEHIDESYSDTKIITKVNQLSNEQEIELYTLLQEYEVKET